VAERLVEPGTVVAAGTPLVRLVDDGRLVVRFAVPPEESVAVGAPVQVRLPGGALRRAIVDRVAPEIDTLARLRVVEALFAPGATADAPALPGTGVLVGPDPAR
jgi:multidrug efflux pump subunit AcrA (membrane-fusion protein)